MVHGNSESGIELESMVQTRASTNGINLLSIEKQAVLPKSRRSGQDDSMTLPPENSFELVFAPLLKDDLGKLKEEFYRKFGQSDTFFSMNNSRPHGLSQDEQKDWEEQLKLLKEELKILKTIDPQRKSSEFATVYLRLGIAEHLVSDGRSELAGEHLDRAVDLLKDGPADKLAVALMRMSEDLIVKDSHRDLWQQREGVRRIPEEAVELLVKAQEAAEKSPLKGQTEHGLILSDLGLINFNREEYAAAEKYLEK